MDSPSVGDACVAYFYLLLILLYLCWGFAGEAIYRLFLCSSESMVLRAC